MDAPAPAAKNAFGLTAIVAAPLERVPVRRRESDVTSSAWRLKVESDQGAGSIVLIEISADRSCFRGDGIFLGWSEARMAEAYADLTRSSGGSDLELLQLG
jgi:hypothetical protein